MNIHHFHARTVFRLVLYFSKEELSLHYDNNRTIDKKKIVVLVTHNSQASCIIVIQIRQSQLFEHYFSSIIRKREFLLIL